MTPTQIDPQNREQQYAYDLVANTNSSFFLTGRAGTGKTTFLHNVQKMVNKQFITVAPTGVAAILAGGETIHSFFGLPLGVCGPGTCGNVSKVNRLAILHADTIIIDEVSMVRCDLMDAIDSTLRMVMRNNAPFGGKQMIFVGDMFQLPPVVVGRNGEMAYLKDLYHTDTFYFYKSRVISGMRLVKIEFRKVYRQEDERFLRILEDVRFNRINSEDLMLLNARVTQPVTDDGEMIIKLTSVNKTADETNNMHLAELDTPEFIYKGSVKGSFDARRYPAESELRLKVGAQIMFIRNDAQRRWVNGTLGKVTNLTQDDISVTLRNGETYIVPQCSWDSVKYTYDEKTRKMEKEVTGTFSQYPIRLAWAITIHKSQGMTFDRLYLDLSRGCFASGQLYVALSRVRSLEGLYLSSEVSPYYARTDKDTVQYSCDVNDNRQIQNEIECGKAVYNALRTDDYDEASRQYLLLVRKKAANGDIREALRQAKNFLDTIISDEHLYGCISDVPLNLETSSHWTSKFLVALLSLYSKDYERALSNINEVLECHHCSEGLYVKSRVLTMLGRYKEADAVNEQMGESFNFNSPDVKVLYTAAMLNEQHIGDPGVNLMRYIVEMRPKYDRGFCSLRMLMRKHGITLDATADGDSKLTEMFNSNATDEAFESSLKYCRLHAPKAVTYLRRRIKEVELQM